MSCTIGALPFLILAGVFSAVTETAQDVSESNSSREKAVEHIKEVMKKSIEAGQGVNNIHLENEEIQSICKEYQTVFLDREVLLKTLKEYGFDEFNENDEKIECKIADFTLEFFRNESSQPYTMKLSCTTDCDTPQLINDVNNEYALNAQEETYIKIKERLEKKNMKIDSEEILEDDSIMLTINLD